jgi:glutathione S-transferase
MVVYARGNRGKALNLMALKLYSQPGSHPCAAVEAGLALKGIDYDRVDLLPLSQVLIGPLRYGGTRVPGMRLDGERIVGSRAIMRRLDELIAEPALLPAVGDPSYEPLLEAERWGDEVFQDVPRRIIDVAFLRHPMAMESYGADAKLPLPRPLLRPAIPLTARMMARRNKASDESARADLDALPAQLDRIDGWIADALLGGDQPNAADLQIGSTIRLLMSIGDVRPLIEGRPAARLTRYFPPMVGEVEPGTLPGEWLRAEAGA